ncbi:MAG: helix-turn-helix domain-containing protein [Eubacteriales bacterium]|nr:helix-turn-helix domain-containing protein [Eubacteriales bacterium]
MNQNIRLIQPLIHTALSASIDNYAVITSPAAMDIYTFTLKPAASHCLSFIPTPYCEWIIGYNNTPKSSFFLCIGPVSKLKTITLPHYEHYMGIRFDDDVCYVNKTASSSALPAGMRNQHFEYSPLADSFEYQLAARLAADNSFSSKITDFIEFLKLSKRLLPIPENVQSLFKQLKNSNGSLCVKQLAASSGYSERHIYRIITNEFGYGPKDYCKYIRFQKALLEIISNPKRGNSEFIQNIGYSDQAHFQREFKLFLGMTPKQFIHML